MKYALKAAAKYEGHPWRQYGVATKDGESHHDLADFGYVALVWRGKSDGPFSHGDYWYEFRFYRQTWGKLHLVGKVNFRDYPKDEVVLLHFARILKKAARDRRRWR